MEKTRHGLPRWTYSVLTDKSSSFHVIEGDATGTYCFIWDVNR